MAPRQRRTTRGPDPAPRQSEQRGREILGLDRLASNQRQIATLEALDLGRVDTRGDRFSMLVDDVRHTKRVDAGVAVSDLIAATMNAARGGEGTDRHAIGVGGLPIDVRCSAGMSGAVEFALRGTTLRFSIERDELRGLDPLRITQRLERLAIRVPDELNDTR